MASNDCKPLETADQTTIDRISSPGSEAALHHPKVTIKCTEVTDEQQYH